MSRSESIGRQALWRRLVSVVCIALATVLSPVAVVGGWAKLELTSTDAFVRTFTPLASDPAVQQVVADRVVEAIDEKVDVAGLTRQAFDGLAGLDIGPRAQTALRTLAVPAANGIQSLITRYVDEFVRSDAFAGVWTQALRQAHSQLVANQDASTTDRAVSIDENGQIGINLAPVIAQVKTVLVDRGVPLAEQIPTIDRTVVVATATNVPKIRFAYNAAVELGIWLPIAALVLFAAGILLAHDRRRALMISAICLTLAMAVTGLVLRIGRIVLVSELAPRFMTAGGVHAIYAQTILMLRSTILAVGAVGVVTAVVAWLSGRGGAPAAVRGTTMDVAASVRTTAERHGLSTGSVGCWLHAQRRLLLAVIAAGCLAVLVLARPLTLGLVTWTVVVALVLLLLLLLLERPGSSAPAGPDRDPPVATPLP